MITVILVALVCTALLPGASPNWPAVWSKIKALSITVRRSLSNV